MVQKKPKLRDRIFVSKLGKTTSSADSLRTIMPFELLKKLKMKAGDRVCWQIDGENRRIMCWRETKRDRAEAASRIIDIKEEVTTTTEGVKPIRTDLRNKSLPLSTASTETEPQITATTHI